MRRAARARRAGAGPQHKCRLPGRLPDTHAPRTCGRFAPRLPAVLRARSQRRSASLGTISRTFRPLSKVLFIFPSRYLFAIGLLPVFSLGWPVPPPLGCIPKQPDSTRPHDRVRGAHGAVTLSGGPFQGTWRRVGSPRGRLTTRLRDSKTELFPLHSPLLGESLLVSPPPLTDMLKSSG